LKDVDIKTQPAYSSLSDEEIARSRHVASLMEIGRSVVNLSLVVLERFANSPTSRLIWMRISRIG